MKYTPVIGLEVHVELKTKSKMFCRCSADYFRAHARKEGSEQSEGSYFGSNPNTHTCPVCLGLPGALPYPNKQAIEWCIKIALALNCVINQFSKFDRKNYFYPDLAKGYQISQYDLPFGHEGFIEILKDKNSSETKKIRIRRVHMEEDTGKLTHAGGNSLVDFNRSGVPLVEIVTEPDFDNEYHVVQYLQNLQKIVRYLGVSNADMEKGDMRLEPNISLREMTIDKEPLTIDQLPKYKVEVKNINSFKFVDRAIKFEIERQAAILDSGKNPGQETRGWNETKSETVFQRSKEEANDYRYFPEPDIPPITTPIERIKELLSEVGELPDEKQARFIKKFELSIADAEILTREKTLADAFEKAVIEAQKQGLTAKQIANVIIHDKVDPTDAVLKALEKGKREEINPGELERVINSVLAENKKAVEEYRAGKENVLQFLLGMVMRKADKKLDPNVVKNGILESLNK